MIKTIVLFLMALTFYGCSEDSVNKNTNQGENTPRSYQNYIDAFKVVPFAKFYWNSILLVRTEVNKALEIARKEKQVGKALEAQVTLFATQAVAKNLLTLGEELRFVLITSAANVEVVESAPSDAQATELDGLWLKVSPANGTKCDRCWHVTEDVGSNESHPLLCGRCITNIDNDGEVRTFA